MSEHLVSLRESLFLWLANHLPRLGMSDRVRYLVVRMAGVRVEGPCLIWGPLTIRDVGHARGIAIGKGTFVNTDVRFGGAAGGITLGRDVRVGPRVSFETFSHGLVYTPGEDRGNFTEPIVVEDGVWIGAGATILQGVTIGRGAVIAAGAVVASDVAPKTVSGGVPARVLRQIEDHASAGL